MPGSPVCFSTITISFGSVPERDWAGLMELVFIRLILGSGRG